MKVYLLCDRADDKALAMDDAPECGVDLLGSCTGRIVTEEGEELGRPLSSTIGWLRSDLMSKLEPDHGYEIIDLLREEVPERFAL